MKHRILAVICALTLALTFGVFTGCQGSKGSVGYQLDMPQKGEEIAPVWGISVFGFSRKPLPRR